MIIDAQVHYGANSDGTYCPVEEAIDVAVAAGSDWIVQVTASATGWDNTDALESMARHRDRVLGVFGRFDPLAPNVEERMRAFQATPGIIGARLTPRNSGAPTGLADRTFDDYFKAAEKLNLAIQVFSPFQVPEIHATARRFPGVRFLIDHLGANRGEKEPFRQWPQLIDLASEPNVWVKVSYFPDIVFEFDTYPYPIAQRYFKELYEGVGSSPLIWASNYPPVKRACSYKEALDFTQVHCTFLNAADKEAILGKNFLANFVPGGKLPS